MNPDNLRKLYKKNKAARAFFDHAAQRLKNQNETKVDRILKVLREEGHDISRSDIIEVFREFEKEKLGNFVIGRRGWSSRFVWSMAIVSAGKAATGESEEVEELPPQPEEDSEELVTHKYRLRSDFTLELKIPADLSVTESKRLSLFVRSLPIEDEDEDTGS